MKEIGNKLKQLTEEAEDILENKKTVNKGDRNQILGQIKSLHQEVNSNIPFFFTMFNEQMDKTVTEAKGEIEARSEERRVGKEWSRRKTQRHARTNKRRR